MSSKAHERFNFEVSPYAAVALNGQTDGTANNQQPWATTDWIAVNGGGISSVMYVEPEQNITLKNEHHILDKLTRLLVFASRDVGTGSWSVDLLIRRTTSSQNQILINIDIPLGTSPAPVAISDPLGANGMKSKNGAETMADKLVSWGTVRPGQAVAANVSIYAVLVPGFVSGESNKGANLSAPQYLTYR